MFFDSCKTVTLVLLRKGTKPLDQLSSYRPLCLINLIGKLFERLFKVRIMQHLLLQPDGISARHYGFMRGKSTTQAIEQVMKIVDRAGTGNWAGSGQLYNRKLCALASLDVANAFYSAPWDMIETAMNAKRFPSYLLVVVRRSYFDGCRILTEEGRCSVTTGVPQGLSFDYIVEHILRRTHEAGVP